MAIVTNALDSYTAIGNREDLVDAIYDISPTDTPFMSAAGRNTATGTFHEWQVDALASQDVLNAQLEGDEVARAASAPTVRTSNICQISRKDASVTGTQDEVNKAGRNKELAYQMTKRTKELKRDMEGILLGIRVKVNSQHPSQNPGPSSVPETIARELGGAQTWLATNTSRGSGGTDPSPADGSDAPGDGTDRAFTEDFLKDVIQATYTSGGNPSTLMVGPFNKQAVSAFIGRTQARQAVSADTILASASIYASDFGDLMVVPNRQQDDAVAFLWDYPLVTVSYLRPFINFPLAKIGDAESRVILSEYTLEMRNEAAHGIVADLLVS